MRMEVNGPCKPGPVQVPISPSGIFGLVFYCSIDEVGPWGTSPVPSFDAFVGTISEANLRFLRAGVGRKRWGWEFWNEINTLKVHGAISRRGTLIAMIACDRLTHQHLSFTGT